MAGRKIPMKLYYSAGSCSTSCHITIEESGLKYEAIGIDFDQESDPNIALVAKLNPLGTLPILLTDDGKQLDQNLSIHTYIAELASDKKLLPAPGTFEYAEAMNLLSFVAADLHKAIGGMFSISALSSDPNAQRDIRNGMLARANTTLEYVESKLAGKDYFLGKQFSVIDPYAYIVMGWTQWLEIPLTPFKNIQAFMARMSARPAVARVLKAEGLE